jgi:hypothetical protein
LVTLSDIIPGPHDMHQSYPFSGQDVGVFDAVLILRAVLGIVPGRDVGVNAVIGINTEGAYNSWTLLQD